MGDGIQLIKGRISDPFSVASGSIPALAHKHRNFRYDATAGILYSLFFILYSIFNIQYSTFIFFIYFRAMPFKNYKAIYVSVDGRQHPATIFLSGVTITSRISAEENSTKDINWLAKDVFQLEERGGEHVLYHATTTGKPDHLIIRDAELLAAIRKQYRGHVFIGGVYHRTLGKTRNKILILAGIFLGFLIALYFIFMPWIGEKIAMGFSKDTEVDLGESMYRSTISTFEIDTAKTTTINAFYRALNYSTGYDVSITVVKSTEVNAFAIPGGHIIVYDAILEGMKSPDELAALLGHEASHIAKRHSLRSIFRSLARKMLLLLVIGSDAGIVSFIADNADELKGLEYSRALETEADNEGMRLMTNAGINPAGMLRLMEILQSGSTGNQPASFLNTHPVFEDRIENIRQQIKKYSADGDNSAELRKLFHDLYENW
ncbi:MAG: M48 family metallopeptidase [Chitinophagaceae bacterium]|nr:M48 family metallopeptidase [Chitinophagaceae bacterium]